MSNTSTEQQYLKWSKCYIKTSISTLYALQHRRFNN